MLKVQFQKKEAPAVKRFILLLCILILAVLAAAVRMLPSPTVPPDPTAEAVGPQGTYSRADAPAPQQGVRCPACGGRVDVRTLEADGGDVAVTSHTTTDHETGATVRHRCYTLPDGDTVSMGRVTSGGNLDGPVLARWRMPADGGVLRWYDVRAEHWREAPLAPGTVRAGCIFLTGSDGGETMIYTPKVYDDLGSGTLRYEPRLDGALEITADGDGLLLELTVPQLPAGSCADWTAVSSSGPLLDWAGGNDGGFWSAYTLDGVGKWCYDGYYYPSPETYTPSGENCHYRLPAAYLVRSWVYGAPQVRAARDLAVAGLDTMLLQQTDGGWFPTLPESQWLQGDYGIGGGFYDTRFNTELVLLYDKAAEWFPCRTFDAAMDRYFDFFLDYAAGHHTATDGGGWLVADYFHPDGGLPTHTSLNHQLSEILCLYHFAGRLERPELARLAGRMLRAVEDTEARWRKSDGSLHYARYPDGTFGGVDYPYLTYNDLFQLQAYLSEQGRPSAALQRLMDGKRAWMDANGVTGYLR